MASIDPQLERQVETIRNLVESYFGIVCKSIRDMVPKTIMFMTVNKLKDYMKSDLLPMIYSSGDQDDMMEESQDAAKRREEMINMYHTCKDALSLISDVNSKMGERCRRRGSGEGTGGVVVLLLFFVVNVARCYHFFILPSLFHTSHVRTHAHSAHTPPSSGRD